MEGVSVQVHLIVDVEVGRGTRDQHLTEVEPAMSGYAKVRRKPRRHVSINSEPVPNEKTATRNTVAVLYYPSLISLMR